MNTDFGEGLLDQYEPTFQSYKTPPPVRTKSPTVVRLNKQAWQDAKDRHPGRIVLMKCNGWYLAFGYDASVVSNVIGCQMGNSSGYPSVIFSAGPGSGDRIRLLLEAGHPMAICEE